MLTAQTCKTDHVGLPGVDDMTLVAVQGSARFRVSKVQGSAFRGSKVKAILDFIALVLLNTFYY